MSSEKAPGRLDLLAGGHAAPGPLGEHAGELVPRLQDEVNIRPRRSGWELRHRF